MIVRQQKENIKKPGNFGSVGKKNVAVDKYKKSWKENATISSKQQVCAYVMQLTDL